MNYLHKRPIDVPEPERWDRRERGETPLGFEMQARKIYEQQLEIDKERRDRRQFEKEILSWII